MADDDLDQTGPIDYLWWSFRQSIERTGSAGVGGRQKVSSRQWAGQQVSATRTQMDPDVAGDQHQQDNRHRHHSRHGASSPRLDDRP